MTILNLLSHSWKQSLRSASRGQKTAGNIIVFVMILLVALNLLGLGLFLQQYLTQHEPGSDPLILFNGWVIYYLGIDLLLRHALQRVPGQTLVPYLTLPVKKSLLVHVLLLRSFFSFFNLLPWVVLIPFAANAVVPGAGLAGALAWLMTLGSLIAANSILNLFLKKLAFHRSSLALIVGAAIGTFFAIDILKAISISSLSQTVLEAVIRTPLLSLGSVLVPGALYALTFFVVRDKMHLEHLAPAAALRGDTPSRYHLLESVGTGGRFLALELKMFFRTRRPRASLITAFSVLPLGVLFYGMMLKAERDPYPLPSAIALERVRLAPPPAPSGGWRVVTFRVDTGIVPPFAHVYVTGNQPALANWKPSAVPLLLNSDSTWSRSFLFEEGMELRYCFTLGAWQTEEKVGDGSGPPTQTMTVRSDTTVFRTAMAWKTPEIPLFVKINLLYWGLLVTGILMFAYGQFFLAWNSIYFDALLTWRIRFRRLLNAKLIMLFAAGTISFVLTLLYGFMDSRILLFNTLAFLYNIGVNSYVMLYFASRHRKRFDLDESIFSQQGKGAAQFVAVVPMWLLPVIVGAVLEGLGVPYALYLFFGGLGLLGILCSRPLLAWTTRLLEKQRYRIAAGFRQGDVV